MRKVQLFEPLGASLGCCGGSSVCDLTENPIVNEGANIRDLERIEKFFNELSKKEGYFVAVHDPSADAFTFNHTASVMKKLQTYGEDVLPIILVDDKIVSMGEFPSNEVLSEVVGLDSVIEAVAEGC